ncbi:TRAP transporter substrate-binding protein [Pasteurellaceae bacterium HPA106]|uniref:TRAP transporter substrate-binding protein n=1 Tax=Spirabiliibacterium pneumoniae TaxID=221400 RepID=UPI001AAE0F65|nr:TRAP transporter substrate-binding protein [Spirabiliibacterium pneumoniae]MBE2897119.1 TRAP transporter substrate-binding protein [Spirabiliibacterium pneumoniae]
MKFKPLFTSLCVALPMLAASAGAMADKVTIKLAHNLEQTHVVHKAIDKMAKDLKAKSNGEIIIRVYPSRQMGDARETLEMVQNDALDMTKVNSSELEPFIGEFAIFNLPYLFKDEDHFKRMLYGDIGKKLADKTQANGYRIVASYVGGTRSFYTKKPVHSPDDLKGMKIRVISTPTTNKSIELLGASPVSLPLGDVYTSLQQGVIDGAENNIPSYASTRHDEVAKFYSADQHTSIPDYLVISEKAWNKMNPEQQKLFMEAAHDSEVYQQKLWDEETTRSKQEAEKLGVTFIEVDKTPFREALKPLFDDFRKDPKLVGFVDEIQSIQDAK